MSTYISENLRTRIADADRRRCCYCLTTEANSGILMTHDHIQPRSKGGETTFENVCLACRTCNEYKTDSTEALDPLTGETVPLFNPRLQRWSGCISVLIFVGWVDALETQQSQCQQHLFVGFRASTQPTTLIFLHMRCTRWSDYFAWSPDGTRVEGLTAIGRATVVALRMNNPVILIARRRWVISGWHPPAD